MKLTAKLACLSVLLTAMPCAQADLIDNGDGTITDSSSDLMWLKNSNNGTMVWAEARIWADELVFGGYDDWRLPSALNRSDGQLCNSQPAGANCTDTEFATLYFGNQVNALAPGVFESFAQTVFWTDTEFPSDTSKAMSQDFLDGGQNPMSKTREFGVWAVRGAQTQCSDGIDNDDDGLVDMNDPNCCSNSDNRELAQSAVSSEGLPQCSDGLDNDDDCLVDFPDDTGCRGANDPSEVLACYWMPWRGWVCLSRVAYYAIIAFALLAVAVGWGIYRARKARHR